jgi:hypothetical protein
MPRYESHITVDKQWAAAVEGLAKDYDWSYSVIAGCPLLGQGTYCYLTGYSTDAAQLKKRVELTAEHLRVLGIKPLRCKIEEIVWDTKTGVDEITPKIYKNPNCTIDHPGSSCNIACAY